MSEGLKGIDCSDACSAVSVWDQLWSCLVILLSKWLVPVDADSWIGFLRVSSYCLLCWLFRNMPGTKCYLMILPPLVGGLGSVNVPSREQLLMLRRVELLL